MVTRDSMACGTLLSRSWNELEETLETESNQKITDRLEHGELPQNHVIVVEGSRTGRFYHRDESDPDLWVRQQDGLKMTIVMVAAEEWSLIVRGVRLEVELDRAETGGMLEPRYPAGTSEYERYAAELRAELRKFAAGEEPYGYGGVLPAGIRCGCGFTTNLGDTTHDIDAYDSHVRVCPRQAEIAAGGGPRSRVASVPWFWALAAAVLITWIITAAVVGR